MSQKQAHTQPKPSRFWTLPSGDLLRDAVFRRIWLSTLIGGVGAQVTMLAMPLAAALLLHATPIQMGWLTALESLPFFLFSLPAGVWLDRVRKLPVYVAGECTIALAVASVPLAWALGLLGMPWLYVVAFVLGSVSTVAGSAAQIVLVQVVAREQLVQAHAKSALASAASEVAGPALAGILVRLLGAPLALLLDAAMLIASALIVRRIPVREQLSAVPGRRFMPDMVEGLRFVFRHPLLWPLALLVATWHLCNNVVVVVQILLATRVLGLSPQAIGLCFVGMGLGAIVGGVLGDRISRRLGPGPCLALGFATTAGGWWCSAFAVPAPWSVLAYVLMLVLLGLGGVLVFINFLALRQSVTPPGLLGRMTSTMRWLILAPAVPGALLGGWMGEHLNLRAPLVFAGTLGTLLAIAAWRSRVIQSIRVLPTPEPDSAVVADAVDGAAARAA